MSGEAKKGETLLGKVILYSVLIFVLVLLYVAYLITSAAAADFWERNLNTNGPWGEQSVWISEEGDLWMISEDRGAWRQVCIYMKTEDGWDEVSMRLVRSDRTAVVGIYETEPIYEGHAEQTVVDDSELFTCSAELKGGALVLSEFAETAVRPFVGERESITLIRYDYAEKIGELPFAHGVSGATE